MTLKTTISISLLSSLISGLSHAASVKDCIVIKDDNQRLACYDSLFLETPKAKDNLQQVSIDTEQKVNTEQSDAIDKTEATGINPQPTSDKPQLNTDLFGMEHKAASTTPDSIESTAIGNFTSWKKNMKITLENGQVWKVTSSGSLYYKIDNPRVVIEKGALGSFYMGIEGINRRLKVKRIK
jgi:hypothetical protein